MFRHWMLPLILAALLPAMAEAQPVVDLTERVHELVSKSPADEAQWGVMVADLESGEDVLSLGAGNLYMPASNRKLFSTAFALDTLGAEYRFTTRLEYAGALAMDGTLAGNLIVRASGDPTISGTFRKDSSPTGIFREWAAALKEKGIVSIDGDLVVDLSCFAEGTKLGEGWSWEYESSYYAAPAGAFSFNENVIFVKVAPGPDGGPCRVSLYPEVNGFLLRNDTTTRSSGVNTISVTRQNGTNLIVAQGLMPRNSETEYNPVAVNDPCRYAAEGFLAVLRDEGISLSGRIVPSHAAVEADSARLVAEYTSPPLSEILKRINQSSNNMLAEMIYLAAGRVATGQPASYEVSRQAEQRFWNRLNLRDAARMHAADGSGLSRKNLFSPRAVCDLLRAMQQHPESEVFVDSLAVSGRKGTLSSRMSSIPERIIGKTGTIANVSCLSGYLVTSDERTVVFSMLVNNFTCSTSSIKAAQDRVCRMLVEAPIDLALSASAGQTEPGG